MFECIDPPNYWYNEDELECQYDKWIQNNCSCHPMIGCDCPSFEEFLENKLKDIEESITAKFAF